MKAFDLTLLLLASSMISFGQTELATTAKDVSKQITSFEYKCERIIDPGAVPKFKILKFEQKHKMINLKFRATANCGDRDSGYVVVNFDTLKIVDNSRYYEEEQIDSLGKKVIVGIRELRALECDCLSNYAYKVKGIDARLRFICFHAECFELKSKPQ